MERERGEADPRQVYARLTDRGFDVLVDATPTHVAGVSERSSASRSSRRSSWPRSGVRCWDRRPSGKSSKRSERIKGEGMTEQLAATERKAVLVQEQR